MKITDRLKRAFALVSLVTLVVAALPTGIVSAASGNPAYCDSDVPLLNNQNFGTEVPVVMVHGFRGDDVDWGQISNPTSFAGRVNNIPGVAVAHRFDYNWAKWVSDKDNGPRLARTIDCISRLSVHNGGKGKVIVVGYSMGGLVARDATGHMSSDGQRDIAEEVGQAITIGTPHTGTNIPVVGVPLAVARGFMKGSAELALLPDFSLNTTVHTIAGDVTRVYSDRRNNEVKREHPNDDTLVSIDSAHAASTSDVNKGGGTKTISCQKFYSGIPFLNWYPYTSDVACEHGRLIQDASSGVREDTITAIEKYVAWLNTPPVTPSGYTAGTITVNFDSRWIYGEYGASGPNEDIVGDDGNGSLLIMNMANWCTGSRTMMECMTDGDWTDHHVGTAPAITVGGRTPDSSILFNQSGTNTGNRMFWCFEAEKVCIDYGTGADVNLQLSPALLDLLHAATWSN